MRTDDISDDVITKSIDVSTTKDNAAAADHTYQLQPGGGGVVGGIGVNIRVAEKPSP